MQGRGPKERKAGCHTSPWEYVFPLCTQAGPRRAGREEGQCHGPGPESQEWMGPGTWGAPAPPDWPSHTACQVEAGYKTSPVPAFSPVAALRADPSPVWAQCVLAKDGEFSPCPSGAPLAGGVLRPSSVPTWQCELGQVPFNFLASVSHESGAVTGSSTAVPAAPVGALHRACFPPLLLLLLYTILPICLQLPSAPYVFLSQLPSTIFISMSEAPPGQGPLFISLFCALNSQQRHGRGSENTVVLPPWSWF